MSSFSLGALAEVRRVGPNRDYAAPCEAFAAASDGDTIELESDGDYDGDVCAITKNGLTIRGVGGLAKIDAAGNNAQGKAIWVIQGDDTVVENVELSGATVPDLNGAGIRQEGTNLTVRGCVFRDNENGILAGDNAESEITIEQSEFDHNGAGDGYSHNLYINHVKKLVFRYNWSHRGVIGHLLKSRAAENHVLYNRITGEDGTSSYELDFPNGGRTYVIGNLIQQGSGTDNPTLLAYLEEGASASNPDHRLYVVNNTFVNERAAGGRFVHIAAGADTGTLVNNVFAGPGDLSHPAGTTLSHNEQENALSCLIDAGGFDYRLVPGSSCVDAGTDPGAAGDFSLLPTEHYEHPRDHSARSGVGVIDVGAYEFGGEETGAGGAPGSGAGGTGGGAEGGDNGSVAAGGSAGSSAGGNPHTEGGGGSGASSNAGANAQTGGTSAQPATRGDDDSGCSCRLAPARGSTHASAATLLVLAASSLLRKRRRAQPRISADRLRVARTMKAMTERSSGDSRASRR